jgi:hypothetical protein
VNDCRSRIQPIEIVQKMHKELKDLLQQRNTLSTKIRLFKRIIAGLNTLSCGTTVAPSKEFEQSLKNHPGDPADAAHL